MRGLGHSFQHLHSSAQQVQSGFPVKVAQDHRCSFNLATVVRFTCCKRSSKLPQLLPGYPSFPPPAVNCGKSSGEHKQVLVVWLELEATLFLSANTELPHHQSYNWQQCYLSRSKCSCMWAWPLAFQGKLFRTIQSQAVKKDCTARSPKLLGQGQTVALDPDSAYTLVSIVPNALFPAKPTEGRLAVTLCAHGCLPAKIKWWDRNRMTAVPAALTLFAFFSRIRNGFLM